MGEYIINFSSNIKEGILGIIGSITAMFAPLYPIFLGLKTWAKKYLNWAPNFLKKVKDTMPNLESELEKKEKEKEGKILELENQKHKVYKLKVVLKNVSLKYLQMNTMKIATSLCHIISVQVTKVG